jgi:hypothetical protein
MKSVMSSSSRFGARAVTRSRAGVQVESRRAGARARGAKGGIGRRAHLVLRGAIVVRVVGRTPLNEKQVSNPFNRRLTGSENSKLT